MATQRETTEYILEHLGHTGRFRVRAMFGEYALYADDKVVALICNDQLYVKIVPASVRLQDLCEQDAPYSGAKPHYLVTEDQLSTVEGLSGILFSVAESLPEKKNKK